MINIYNIYIYKIYIYIYIYVYILCIYYGTDKIKLNCYVLLSEFHALVTVRYTSCF